MRLTDGTGATISSYTYDAFGATLTGPSGNAWQFTGEQRDGDSGLYYLRARYYDPGTGRFLTRDPVSGFADSPASQNRYPYALGNPVNRVDPSGEMSVLQFLIALRPAFECATTDFACIGDYLGAITLYNNFVLDVLADPDLWTAVGQLVGGFVAAGACVPPVLLSACLAGWAIYWFSSAVEYELADTRCERDVSLATSVAGSPLIRGIPAYVIAALIGGAESPFPFGDASVCHATPAYGDGGPLPNKE